MTIAFVFVVNIDAFPPDLLTFSYAITNIVSRLVSLTCPLFSEMGAGEDSNIQLYGLIGMLAVGAICSLAVKDVSKKKQRR